MSNILEMRKEYMLPCLGYFYKEPPVFVSGKMQYLYDNNGKKYLDFFAGVSVINCGHSNPFILKRTISQLEKLQHVCNIYLTEPVVELAKKMSQILPGDAAKKSFFVNSGTEAVEGALLLARLATEKSRFIALNGSLHGRTYLTSAVTAIPMWRTDPFLPSENIATFLDTSNYEKAVEQLANILRTSQDFAAFIAEPIQGNAGIITPPDWFFSQISALLKQHNVLFIADEMQTGFARTGKMFAIEHYNVVPDIVAYGKALGNGIPCAGFSAAADIADKFTKPSASTLGGNPVSCATALAVLEYIETENLLEKAQNLGDLLMRKLANLQKKHGIIKNVRGKGLMLGVELETAEQVDFVLETAKTEGVILGRNGITRNVIALQPPLIITTENVATAIATLDNALTAIYAHSSKP
ncbi:MAG: aspartate aminotransferase family protein [Defluviitaleaceae bacterium]|nr:aspartate aminotransferase family protein [Defluviitaleaceae bacterium]